MSTTRNHAGKKKKREQLHTLKRRMRGWDQERRSADQTARPSDVHYSPSSGRLVGEVGGCFLRDGCEQRCRDSCDTRDARRYAVLAVLCADVPVCVCTWSRTFSVHGETECHFRLRTAQRVPSPRVWHTVTPRTDQPLSTNIKGSPVLLSP